VTSTLRGLRQTVRVAAYSTFYRLPSQWRRRVVRLAKPRFTVGAVVLVRDRDATGAGRLLLLRQPPGHGWSLPGGLLNRNELAVDAAARELAEETGIRLLPDELRQGVPNAIVHTDGRWIDLVFDARVPADTPMTVDGAEVYEAMFHPIDALPPLSVPTAKLLAYFGMGPYVAYPEVTR
jgi:ADP-ribose pyrophosphatase YjhB (NUDIX family)